MTRDTNTSDKRMAVRGGTPTELTISAGTALARGEARERVGRWRSLFASRRGVAAVLAMMFLILFGSLAAAMAVVSKGNTVTAATHQRVLRAHGAAETGLRVAQARLAESANQFLVADSVIDTTFGRNLWNGSLGSIGTYRIVKPKSGRQDLGDPTSLADAVAKLHAQDVDVVTEVGISAVTIANALAGVSSDYATSNWVYTPAVAIEPRVVGSTIAPVCYQVTYAPLANGTDIRIISTGYDYSYTRNGQPVTRTVMQDFRLVKRVNHAIVSPSRVMVGKNVMIEGDVGARFSQVANNNGDPLVLRSDFYGLATALDRKLDDFFAGVRQYDVDGDNRLRFGHPVESSGVPAASNDYDSNGTPDNAFGDVTGDGYLDDFDIFLKHFDTNNDGRLALSWSADAAEFTVDNDLALLIDSAMPDRNKNGVSGWTDTNGNGRYDSGETMADVNTNPAVGENPNRDQVLGWMDGYIDKRDRYAKVRGSLAFKVSSTAWTAAQGDIGAKVRGAIVPDDGEAPRRYEISDNDLPAIDSSTFATTRTTLQSAADGQSFARQVATQLGIAESALTTYVESKPAGSTQPRFLRLDADGDNDGRPDNWTTAYFEKMPFSSPNFSDYYYRPVYENMVFKDVVIPAGSNALFRNCTFVGVTWVRSETNNTHVLWGEYGKMKLDSASGRPIPFTPRSVYGDTAGEASYPAMLPGTAIPPTQMILMANPPMDKADIPADQVALTQGYDNLPDPLVIGGKRVTDTKSFSNNLRFHDCLFVGSLVSDSPTNYTQSRNKMQFTGGTRFTQKHPTEPNNSSLNPESIDMSEIQKSSLMVPQYSVDLGSFNSPTTQNLRMTGAIIAGVMDVRGNADIQGALLLTYAPTAGQGPLRDALGNAVGNPAGFNATLGYFGPNDGDEESVDPNTLPLVSGQRLVGYDTNGDGLVDDGATTGTPIYFNGFGKINLRYDPNMVLPNGVMLPMQTTPISNSYKEGKL